MNPHTYLISYIEKKENTNILLKKVLSRSMTKKYICYFKYNRLSLSRLRWYRITAYLEVKIWSLFTYENLTTDIKILWKRWELAPKEQFLLFYHNIFNISLTSGVKLHIHLWNVVVQFIFSSILQIWYDEVQISRSISESALDFEIPRVDCSD